MRSGFVDLRPPPRKEPGEWPAWDAPEVDVDRVAALLGIQRGPGTVLFIGAPATLAAEYVAKIEDVQAAAIGPALGEAGEAPGVSRLLTGAVLPFFSRMLRGVVLDGRVDSGLVSEAARVIGAGSRVVVLHAPDGAADQLREAGLQVLAEEAGTIVAARS